ncbi:MAG: dihydroorotase [Pseudomonadota bacterium]
MLGLLIQNARLAAEGGVGKTQVAVRVARGRIVELAPNLTPNPGESVIDANEQLLMPGVVDMKTFAADHEAAIAGGVTTLAIHPRKSRVQDRPSVIASLRKGAAPNQVNVEPIGAATKALEGTDLAEIGLMKAAGAVGFANGRRAISDATVLLRLMRYAQSLDTLIYQHAEEPSLTHGAVATEGETAQRMGLPAAPAFAEAMMIARDLRLVRETGCRYHVGLVTTAEAIDLIRTAKAEGLPVSAATAPAYFLLNDIAVNDYRTFLHLSPPLREESDRQAVIGAIADGTIDAIVSDHDPRTAEEKRLPFEESIAGMVGLETLLPLTLKLYHSGAVPDLSRLIDALTRAPADLIQSAAGRIEVGAPADLILVDLNRSWRIDSDKLASAAKNTGFDKLPVEGRVELVVAGGHILLNRHAST